MRAEYRVDLREPGMNAADLADLVAWLPPGAPLWRAVGGALAWSPVEHVGALIVHGLDRLEWRQTEDGAKGRNPPDPISPPPLAGEANQAEAKTAHKARIHAERQARRSREVTDAGS